MLYKRSVYMNKNYNFIQERVDVNAIKVIYIPTDVTADRRTKRPRECRTTPSNQFS